MRFNDSSPGEDFSPVPVRPVDYPAAEWTYYPENEREPSFRDYLQVIMRRKWIAITFFIAVVTTVTIATSMMKPLYKSTITVKIDKENQGILSFKDVYSPDTSEESYFQTEFKMLKSRDLARKVIRLMGADLGPGFASLANQRGRENASPHKDIDLAEDRIDPSLIDAFLSAVEVTPLEKTRLVKVSYISNDPKIAARATDSLVRSFMDFKLESKFDAASQARDWLEKQLDEMKAKLEQAEEKLNEYAAQNGIIFIDKENKDEERENVIIRRLSELSTQLTTATSDRIAKEALYREVMSGDPGSDSRVLDNPLIQALKKDCASAESDYNQNLKIYKPDYPKMVRTKSLLDQLKRKIGEETDKIVSSIKSDYDASVKRENYLKADFAKMKQQALDINGRSVQYQILKREADTNKELYNGLLQRMKETGISASLAASNIQIVDKAEVPRYPFRPRKALNFMLSLVCGLFGGIALAFFAEHLDNTVKTPEDVEKRLFMPSLGLVPYCPKKERNLPMEYIVASGKNNRITDAYASIRTFLLFSTAGRPPKILMVTSAGQGEGKSTTTINSAISFTKSNKKTILIDADLRMPKIHQILKLNNTVGLSSFLSGNAEFSGELLKKTNITGLDVVTAGPIPPNPAELLGSMRFRELLEGLYSLYDHILIDTPPVLGLSDAVLTSTHADGVIIVIRSGKTSREAAQQVKRIFEGVNTKILGVVVNGITDSEMRYGYSSYYKGYYGTKENNA